MTLRDVGVTQLGGWADRHPYLAGLAVLLAIGAACLMAAQAPIIGVL